MNRQDVPDEVTTLSPDEQVAWFRGHQGFVMHHTEWDEFYVDSTEHRGLCCSSCIEDKNEGFNDMEPHCCCIGIRAEQSDSPAPDPDPSSSGDTK